MGERSTSTSRLEELELFPFGRLEFTSGFDRTFADSLLEGFSAGELLIAFAADFGGVLWSGKAFWGEYLSDMSEVSEKENEQGEVAAELELPLPLAISSESNSRGVHNCVDILARDVRLSQAGFCHGFCSILLGHGF